MSKPLALTELVLRDAHQSLLATRMRIEDMLPIAEKLDNAGFWSIESWGGATFDACIRYLGEDPWERIRLLKAAMPKRNSKCCYVGRTYSVTVIMLMMWSRNLLNVPMKMVLMYSAYSTQ